MLTYTRVKKNSRLLSALTGLKKDEFQGLIPTFEKAVRSYDKKNKKNLTIGFPPKLTDTASKLLFILFYFKCYPTFDLAGVIYDVDRSTTCRWVHKLSVCMEKALGLKGKLPKRKIRTYDELLEFIPEIKEVIVDGTERPIRRPKDKEKQKKKYSGKKKRHTNKNLLIADSRKRILYLSKTVDGRIHDYTLFKEEKLGDRIPFYFKTYFDSAFQGVKDDFPLVNSRLPKKKPKNCELSATQKSINKRISRKRVIVENAICGIKRYRCLTDVYRNIRNGFEDQVMNICSGLWNYHLA